MILKCKLCKQRCHQTKSFGHSPSRQIWRPCSAHAPCPPPSRSPWLPPAGQRSWPGRRSSPAPAPPRCAWRAPGPERRAGGEPRAREGWPGAAAAPFPAQTPLPGPGREGPRRVALLPPHCRSVATPPPPHSARSGPPNPSSLGSDSLLRGRRWARSGAGWGARRPP